LRKAREKVEPTVLRRLFFAVAGPPGLSPTSSAVYLSPGLPRYPAPFGKMGNFWNAPVPLDCCPGRVYPLSTMVLPLALLESFQGNVYEMTCAAMKRSIQINLAGDDELEANHGKIVSTALKQILTEKVRYRHPDA
jgi:DNA-directed RNA polymerase subunit omega